MRELDFALPRWVTMLENGHWLQTQVYDAAMQLAEKVSRMKDVPAGTDAPALECDAVQRSSISGIDLAAGSVRITVELKPEIFYQVLSEQTGLAIGDEAGLMPCIMELARAKREYEKVRSALASRHRVSPAFPVGVPSLPRPTSSTVNRKELLRRIFFWVCAMR